METTSSKLEARDYVRIILRRWWFILVVALAATLVGGIIAMAMPKTYRAVATVVVPQQQQGVLLMGGQQKTEDFALETQALIAGGNEVAMRTAKTLAEGSLGPKIIVDPSEVTKAVITEAVKPNLIRIQAVHETQLWAREFANQTAMSFLDVMEEVRKTRSAAAVEYLDQQVAKLRVEMEDLLSKKRQLQKQWGVSFIPQQTPTGEIKLVATMSEDEPGLRKGLNDVETDLAAARARRATLQSQAAQLASLGPQQELVGNPLFSGLLEQLDTAQLALVQLKARYQPNHPAVQEMDARIVELDAALRQTSALIRIPRLPDRVQVESAHAALQSAQQTEADLSARAGALQQALVRARNEKLGFVERESILRELDTQIDLRRKAYEDLLTQLQDRRLSVASESGRTALVDSALTAVGTAPSLTRAVVFSLSIGLFLGLALALLLEALDDTVRRPEDISRDPDIRFLGIVPWVTDVTELIMTESPKSPPAEAFRTLRSNINFALVDHPIKTLLITSAGASEGKSLTVANLAVAFAQSGQRVVVVDTDLRRPTQHRLFKADNSRGLTNVLVGEASLAEVLQDTAVPNLRILASGPLPPNPAELLDSGAMTALLAEIRDLADLVVMDSPPAVVLTDALLVASRVDQVLLVASAGQVTREAFDEMVRLLRHARGHILGAMLNKLKVTTGDYYYYYYYYYYDYNKPRRGGPGEPPSTAPLVEEPASAEAPASREDLPF